MENNIKVNENSNIFTVDLEKYGYYPSSTTNKCIQSAYYTGFDLKEKKKAVSIILRGPYGAGKTTLAKTFAKAIGAEYLQYTVKKETVFEDLYQSINIAAIIRKDADNVMTDCVFAKMFKMDKINTNTPIVILLDEIDKGPKSVEQSIYNILEGGEIDDKGIDDKLTGNNPIYVFMCSNKDQRDLEEGLFSRSILIEMNKITGYQAMRAIVDEFPELSMQHYIRELINSVEKFTIRDAITYLYMLRNTYKIIGGDNEWYNYIDHDLLSCKRVNLKNMNIDLKNIHFMEEKGDNIDSAGVDIINVSLDDSNIKYIDEQDKRKRIHDDMSSNSDFSLPSAKIRFNQIKSIYGKDVSDKLKEFIINSYNEYNCYICPSNIKNDVWDLYDITKKFIDEFLLKFYIHGTSISLKDKYIEVEPDKFIINGQKSNVALIVINDDICYCKKYRGKYYIPYNDQKVLDIVYKLNNKNNDKVKIKKYTYNDENDTGIISFQDQNGNDMKFNKKDVLLLDDDSKLRFIHPEDDGTYFIINDLKLFSQYSLYPYLFTDINNNSRFDSDSTIKKYELSRNGYNYFKLNREYENNEEV